MAQYDEKILLKTVIALEVRASQIVFWTALKYGAMTCLIVGIASALLRATIVHDLPAELFTGALTAIAIFTGVINGRDKAFDLRLEAQRIMALVQIERNTHPSLTT